MPGESGMAENVHYEADALRAACTEGAGHEAPQSVSNGPLSLTSVPLRSQYLPRLTLSEMHRW